MRRVMIALSCFLLSATAGAECVTVTTTSVVPLSSSAVSITALQGGKPLEGTVIEVLLRMPGGIRYSLVTEANGTATLPKLSPGTYVVTALSVEGKVAGITLTVPEGAGSNVTNFSIDLNKGNMSSATPGLEANEEVAEFRGILQDENGGVLPGGTIAVYEKNSDNKRPVALIHSDSSGRFSAELKDGSYTAVFSVQGFRAKVVPIQVSKAEGAEDVVIKLMIGMSC
jgi:hypothetical protein